MEINQNFNKYLSKSEISGGAHPCSVNIDFEMEMICGGASRYAHGCDILSSCDSLSHAYRCGGAMCIEGGKAVSVVDFNISAPARGLFAQISLNVE